MIVTFVFYDWNLEIQSFKDMDCDQFIPPQVDNQVIFSGDSKTWCVESVTHQIDIESGKITKYFIHLTERGRKEAERLKYWKRP